jgi:hypothetical protein
MSAVWDVATVMAGSLLFVLFFYVPDFAYGISDGVGRLVGKGT